MFETPPTQPHRFIVPLEGVNTFCTFRDGKIVPENALPMVGFLGHAIDPDFGWVAWIADGGRAIGRVHLDAIEGEHGFASLPMPEGYKAGCLLFHKQVLFVGGNCGKEVIGRFDFSSSKPEWVPLEVPEQFRRYGKHIDDLLLDGDRLIAVDDYSYPKYLLVYEVKAPCAPVLAELQRIPALWWGEHIQMGAVGSHWLALLSCGGGSFVGPRLQIGLYDRRELGLLGYLAAATENRSGFASLLYKLRQRTWHHLTFTGDTLLIAAGRDGVGVLELSDVEAPPSPVVCESSEGPSMDLTPIQATHEHFSQECERALRYFPPPDGLAVTRVVPMPGTGHYLAVVDTEPGFDTVVMELP